MKKHSKKTSSGHTVDTYEGVKPRNPYAVLAKQKTGAGKHVNKALRGSGKHSGTRHAKHKKGLRNPEEKYGLAPSSAPVVTCQVCSKKWVADISVPYPYLCCSSCAQMWYEKNEPWPGDGSFEGLLFNPALRNPPNVVSATAGLAGAALLGAGFLWFGWLSPKLGLACDEQGRQSSLNAKLAAGFVVGFMGLWVVAMSAARD